MQYIEWENGIHQMRHRKLIQGLPLNEQSFYALLVTYTGCKKTPQHYEFPQDVFA